MNLTRSVCIYLSSLYVCWNQDFDNFLMKIFKICFLNMVLILYPSPHCGTRYYGFVTFIESHSVHVVFKHLLFNSDESLHRSFVYYWHLNVSPIHIWWEFCPRGSRGRIHIKFISVVETDWDISLFLCRYRLVPIDFKFKTL